MDVATTERAATAAFLPIDGVLSTRLNAPLDGIMRNIKRNLRRDLPRLHQLARYGQYAGPEPLAIVAGGPSLNKTLDKLRVMDRIMVCGTAHDHLVRAGFYPNYAVLCDADPASADFIQKPLDGCHYLVATCCHNVVFERLRDHRVTMWNTFHGDRDCFGGEPIIQGGCTATLRAISIGVMLGYLRQEFFGLDSSFEDDDDHHAYPGAVEQPERINVRVGGDDGRVFRTTPGWLAQATHFREMVRNMGYMFSPVVHGDGLIAEMMKPQRSDA